MEFEIDELFRRFIARLDRDALAAESERVLKEKAPQGGGMSVFANTPGGLIGFTLRKLLLDSGDCCSRSDLDDLVDRLVKFYSFPEDRRRIIEQLQRDLGKSVDLAPIFDRAAALLQCVENAFLFGDDSADALLAELRQVE